LSRPDFLHKEKAVGKIVRDEKIGKPSKGVELFYVKWRRFPQGGVLVENPCGKPCGECGKLWFINRYPVGFQTKCPVKNVHILVCIIPSKCKKGKVTSPGSGRKFQRKKGEKVYNFVIFAVKEKRSSESDPKFLVELYKVLPGIICQALEILVLP
jgi:hypothetical protein